MFADGYGYHIFLLYLCQFDIQIHYCTILTLPTKTVRSSRKLTFPSLYVMGATFRVASQRVQNIQKVNTHLYGAQ